MKHTLSLIALVAASHVVAGETRELDAHVHGTGNLDIAVDGTTVAMEFHAPGADIVGFEYDAKTEEDRAAIDSAVATLARPLDLFVLPAGAECTVTQASAMLEIEGDHDHPEHDDHEHEDEEHAAHDDHDHDHDHEEHAEHDDHDHEEHAEHDDHGHEEHAEHEHAEAEDQHTEFHAEYTLNCASPEALDTIEFAYFETFENALELEVQIVTEAGAQAFEVLRDKPTLDLQNLF